MSFDLPNLLYLDHSDALQLQYPVVNLGSLVEAKIDIEVSETVDNCDPSNLIKGLRNVKILLSLSFPKTLELYGKFHESVPVFEKLIRLCIKTEVELCLSAASSLPSLLKGSSRELGQIKRFLEELSCLELVKVCASADDDMEMLRITTDLLMLCRAYSKCRIQVQFF